MDLVVEEVIGRWTAGVLGAVVLAAVSSVVTVQWFLGVVPLAVGGSLGQPTKILARTSTQAH